MTSPAFLLVDNLVHVAPADLIATCQFCGETNVTDGTEYGQIVERTSIIDHYNRGPLSPQPKGYADWFLPCRHCEAIIVYQSKIPVADAQLL